MERLLWCIVWYYTSDQASNRVRLALHRMQSRLYTAYAHAKQTLPQIFIGHVHVGYVLSPM
jgi:hypothetical protein